MSYPAPLDLSGLKVYPLGERNSLCRIEDVLISPDQPPAPCSDQVKTAVRQCAREILSARERGAGVILMYGAHLLRNGAGLILGKIMAQDWVTHLATNGAGTIHDWEYAYHGRSTEDVAANVATGTFGTWDETGRWIHLALLAGGLRPEGYGQALGRLIMEEGLTFPSVEKLEGQIRTDPGDALTPARAELACAMRRHSVAEGHHALAHRWKNSSILGQAFQHEIPLTVHPGIGYDIISNHPMFNGAAIGRAADWDFRLFGRAVDALNHGVVLAVGSAIMAPQVFEKSLSCVNNLRLQQGRSIVKEHSIYVVDIQDGGGWDWTQGEPPKDHPAYYLRFCKSFSRMGGVMRYVQCDNVAFLQHLYHELNPSLPRPAAS